ncbi:NDUFAF6 [Acanthosepion pharaonis]|uniref:NADH dehydrogenase (ubiquinone) complex I, assembly factor 6 n=1 Tax=Acanthosepion pharaonis TaxID=158019 RepID=A0A812APT0_ACAPH|nr:NDUFAF6 [Sepia pharaonis]
MYHLSNLFWCEICNLARQRRQIAAIYSPWKNKSTSSKEHSSSAEICVDIVRKSDFENYLCTLLYPKQIRTSGFALRAFNVEIAQIKDLVKSPQLGEIRMQYWKDTVDNIYQGTIPPFPVGKELARAIHEHKLSKHWLFRIIETRKTHLTDAPFTSISHLEDYAEKTVSSLNYLLLESSGVKNVQADHILSHLGKAQGIVTQLRATPYTCTKHKLYLPLDVLIKHRVPQEYFFRRKSHQAVKDVIFEIASAAHQHLNTVKNLKSPVTKEMQPVLNSLVLCEQYLKKLQKADFDIFHPKLQQRDNLLPVKLWLQSIWP